MSQGVTTDKFDTLQLDLKALENAISLSSLAVPRLAPEEPKLPEIHAKLDSIAKLCEDLLAQGTAAPKGAAVAVVATGRDANKSPIMPGGPMGAKSEEEKSAGEEVAQIMADLVSDAVRVLCEWRDVTNVYRLEHPSTALGRSAVSRFSITLRTPRRPAKIAPPQMQLPSRKAPPSK
jgi:hypothetical protein